MKFPRIGKLAWWGWGLVVMAGAVLLLATLLKPPTAEDLVYLVLGVLPATLLLTVAALLGTLNLVVGKDTARWPSVGLLVVAWPLPLLVAYVVLPEPRLSITRHQAERGNVGAMLDLQSGYFFGTGGLEEDRKAAAEWTEMAALAGHRWSALEWGCLHDPALEEASFAFEFGLADQEWRQVAGIETDAGKAVRFYQMALQPPAEEEDPGDYERTAPHARDCLQGLSRRLTEAGLEAEKKAKAGAGAGLEKIADEAFRLALEADPENEDAAAGGRRVEEWGRGKGGD